jgi:hypothetical protein
MTGKAVALAAILLFGNASISSAQPGEHNASVYAGGAGGIRLHVWSFYHDPAPMVSRERQGVRIVEQSRNPWVKAAYQEMVRAWTMLAESAEQLASSKSIRPDLAQAA